MKKNIATPSGTKKILNEYGIDLKKGLGQNFLIDRNIVNKIIDESEIEGDEFLIEIGPGIGSLTEELLESLDDGLLFAVEKDKRMVEVLEDIFADADNLILITEDALNINWTEMLKKYNIDNRRIKLAANLPYYVTTPIIMSLLESEVNFESMIFMVQREVGERICAGPDEGKTFGSLSVAVQFYMDAEMIHRVPSSVFIPQPDVESVLVKLNPHRNNLYRKKAVNKDFFFQIMHSIFQQRRKTIRNSLSKSSLIDIERDIITQALKNNNIDLKKRGEKLTILEMIELSNEIYHLLGN
ncbi:MAG: 16S rRNA (adenine(1518)-N(6)/adenine(1519)-N(6))-dimethyltransferase RsmA [Bacillota bacterium]